MGFQEVGDIYVGGVAGCLDRTKAADRATYFRYFVDIECNSNLDNRAYDPTIAVAAPWRISAYLAPLSWVVIISAVAKWFDREIGKERLITFSLFMTITMIGALIASVWGIVKLDAIYERKKTEVYYAVSRAIEEVHQIGNQYLVPVGEENIGMQAGVPVYVTWKTHPTKDTEFLHWYDRIETARAVYDGKVPTAEIFDYLNAQSVTHVVWPTFQGEYPYAHLGQQLYIDENYSLWDMRSKI